MSPQTRTFLYIAIVAVIILILGGIAWFFFIKTPQNSQNGTTATSSNPFGGTSGTTGGNIADAGAPASKYEDHGKYYDIDLQYPSATPLASTAGAQADAKVVQILKDFSTNAAAGFKSDSGLDSLTAEDIKMQGLDSGRKYAFSDTYQYYSSPKTVSYLFSVYSDTLGAHPNSYFEAFTFDAKTGQKLALSNLFAPGSSYLNTLSSLTRASITQQLGADGDTDMISSGTAPSADNFQDFVLDGSNLVIYFPPYQVAAYAAGPQTVKIPLSQLSSILNPSYK